MTLTVFTSNQPRHLALIHRLRDDGHVVLAVIEPKSWSPWGKSDILRDYWTRVQAAEMTVFGPPGPVVVDLIVPMVELSHIGPGLLPLDSDRYLVFGSSYIRGWLADFLIDRGALNLHGGLAPYYRGAAPNFWAVRDGNRHLVGAQVQRLSTGLDAGEILATTRHGDFEHGDPFLAGMEAIRRGHELVRVLLETREPWIPVMKNDRAEQIAYHVAADFTEEVADRYLATLR